MSAVDRWSMPPSRLLTALDTMRDQIAPGASDRELEYFARVCNRLELSPFADQIVLIGRYDKRLRRDVYRHQITVAGRRTLATRTGRLAGIAGPEWCGPRDASGALVWHDVWPDDEKPPYCARVLVYVHGWTVPANGTAKWSEFAQTTGEGRLLPTWQAMPSHMLGKCAESMALRRAFPDTLTADVVDGFAASRDPDGAPELDDADAEQAVLARPSTYDPPPPDPAPAPPVEARAGFGPSDQATAHRAVAMLDDDDRATFLQRHAIHDFGAVWPDAAVDEVMTQLEAAP